jgi:hypothetical protein
MFVIEYAVAQGQANPSVIYRVETRADTLGVAEQVALGTLDSVRRMFPADSPDGFQILDDHDNIVFKSWHGECPKLSIFEKAVLSNKRLSRDLG